MGGAFFCAAAARARHLFRGAALAAVLIAGTAVAAENEWSRVERPTHSPAQAIGGAAHGCVAGAARLPADGLGYEVIRLSRHRYYGHPDTVHFVERLGQRAFHAGLPTFYVGDLGQARGGPLPFGHASHQNGLDVDIWFNLKPKPRLVAAAREEVELPSMLVAGSRQLDMSQFGARQVMLLRMAASDPHVDRIFVNPVIKAALCRGVGGAGAGDREWLHRIRPWWGHDEHFHVRLACPAGSPQCEAQQPIPPGDGCDAALEDWVDRVPPAPLTPAPPEAHSHHPALPAACRSVLAKDRMVASSHR